jgi:AAA domain
VSATNAQTAAQAAEAVAKRENFQLLITKEALAKEIPSWLSQHAKLPSELSDAPVEWLVDQVFMRTGLHIFAAKYGSFKSIMSLFLALALMTGLPYLGRATQTQFGEDTRPLHIYYLDRENPQSFARACCLHISLGFVEGENGNVFRVLGEWQDEPQAILFFDDPRLFEAARRERAFFIFDSLSQFIGAANENDNSEMTIELNKAKALARISEGVLILHHDDKGQSGWRGCTAIMAVPDMCFNLSRDTSGGNRVTFSDIRFRPTGSYSITAQVSFGNDANGFDKRYSYTVVDSTLGASERITRKGIQKAQDHAVIEQARQLIEDNAREGKKPMSQRKLAKLLGIATNARDRLLVASTENDPRPWKLVNGNVSLEFHPLDEEQRAIVVEPEQMALEQDTEDAGF